MNAIATSIIEYEQDLYPGKYIVLTGNSHVCRTDNIEGVANLLGIPSVKITDSKTIKRRIHFNPSSDYRKPTVKMQINPDSFKKNPKTR
jgi:hypothetical protein